MDPILIARLMFCRVQRFKNYMMETERALDLMVALVFYASENKTNPGKGGRTMLTFGKSIGLILLEQRKWDWCACAHLFYKHSLQTGHLV